MVTIHRTSKEKAALIAQYIERNPDKPAAYEARVTPYGVSVWVIVSRLAAVNHGDLDRAAAEYDLPREAVEAALAYYEQHKEAVDAKIDEVHAWFHG